MIRHCLFTGLMLVAIAVSGQASRFTVSTKIGEKLDDAKFYEEPIDTLGSNGGYNYFVIRRNNAYQKLETILLRGVNSQLTRNRSIELPLKYDGVMQDYVHMALDGETFHLYTSFHNRRSDKDYLLVTDIDAGSLEVSGQPRVLQELDGVGKLKGDRFKISGHNVSGRLLLTYLIPQEGSDKNFTVHFSVLDSISGTEYSYVFTPQTALEEIINGEGMIDEEGNLFFISTESNGGDRRSDETVYLRYLHLISEKGGSEQRRLIDANGKRTYTPTISVSRERMITVSGVYGNPKSGRMEGVYLCRYQRNNLTLGSCALQRISTDDDGLLVGVADGEETSSEAVRYMRAPDKSMVLSTADGGGYLYMQGIDSDMSMARSQALSVPVYEYLDHLVLRFGKAGNIEWVRSVPYFYRAPKVQFLSTGSTFLTLKDDDLLMIFTDSEGRLRKFTGEAGNIGGGLIVRCVRVTPDNTISDRTVNKYKEDKQDFHVEYTATDAGTGAFIHYTGRRYKRQFARVVVR